MAAENPAIAFLRHFQPKTTNLLSLVESYVQHVLIASDTYTYPVDMDKVFERFNLDVHAVPLLGQRGALTPDLEILVNSSDKEQTQKFSLAHELIEMLATALQDYDVKGLTEDEVIEFVDKKKEVWCEIGAAEMVMPKKFFFPLVREIGISMEAAQAIARTGGISLIATIRQMLKTDMRSCALVIWCYGHKPKEFVPSLVGQLSYLDNADPPKKFRVEQAYKSSSSAYIRQHKSVELDTVIGKAFEASTGSVIRGYSYLEITSSPGIYLVEAIHIGYGGQNRVLSLIYFDDHAEESYLLG